MFNDRNGSFSNQAFCLVITLVFLLVSSTAVAQPRVSLAPVIYLLLDDGRTDGDGDIDNSGYDPIGFVDSVIDGRTFKLCPHAQTTTNSASNVDSDRDGWGNACETAAGTDPNDPDTDNDGFLDGADENPHDPNLPLAAGYQMCSLGTAMNVDLSIPLSSICTGPLCSQAGMAGAGYHYNASNQGSITVNLDIPANFNGTLIYHETPYSHSELTANAPDFEIAFALDKATLYPQLMAAGYGIVTPKTMAIMNGDNFDISSPLPMPVERYYGRALDWANQVIRQSLCPSATSSIVMGDGVRAVYMLSRLRSENDPSFDAAYLYQTPSRGLETHADLLLYYNMVLQASAGSWPYGDLNAPSPNFTIADVPTRLRSDFTGAQREFARFMYGGGTTNPLLRTANWFTDSPSLEEVIYTESLFNLLAINDAYGGPVASNQIPSPVTLTMSASNRTFLTGLGLPPAPLLAALNGNFIIPSATARLSARAHTQFLGDVTIPMSFVYGIGAGATSSGTTSNSFGANSPVHPSYGNLLPTAFSAAGNSSLLRYCYSAGPSGSDVTLLNVNIPAEFAKLKAWVEDGISAAGRAGSDVGCEDTGVPAAWVMTPI